MKALKLILACSILFAFGCKDGYLEEIKAVDPGADESAPGITISYPVEGTEIKVYDEITSINIKFEVTDDIEVQSISLNLDGAEIASYSEFKDYRRYVGSYTYESLADGDHTLKVSAVDSEGKTTSKSVNFAKVPPYIKKYDGEIFYMPFDGDNIELISVTYPSVVGNPSFAGEGKVGGNAYAGAENSYLTFPTADLISDEFSAVFWMKVDAVPNRAGILVAGPVDEANPTAMNNRTSGFRFFREGSATAQRFKLNVGNGTADTWVDGGTNADVIPNTGEWTHFAFTISNNEAIVYINGNPVKTSTISGIDWTSCDVLSIMSGAPRFTGWSHLSDLSFMDELRLFNKALSAEDIQSIIVDEGGSFGYQGEFGEKFYMPFEGDYIEEASGASATVVGTPTFAGAGLRGNNAYLGVADSYLTFPSESIETDEISVSMWYKMTTTPDRAGILVVGPPDPDKPDTPNNRKTGFRFFREGSATTQRFKLNVGMGDADKWFDGGTAADVDATDEWIHLAFTISQTEGKVYINGNLVSSDTFDGIDWTNCDIMSIGSGAPRFTEWGHLSDLSNIDELRIFDRVISEAEIQAIVNAK